MSFYTATTIGARETNEDRTYMLNTSNYISMFILDGHGGTELVNVVDKSLKNSLDSSMGELDVNSHYTQMIEYIQSIYDVMLKDVDIHTTHLKYEGTTITLILYNKKTGISVLLQLGDSSASIIDKDTGDILIVDELYHIDRKVSIEPKQNVLATSMTHDFSDCRELEYIKNILPNDVNVITKKKPGTNHRENRVEVCLCKKGLRNILPEPSRTIEARKDYEPLIVDFQREPEYVVWQLKTSDIIIALYCDGFISKLAIPSHEHIAKLIHSPRNYLSTLNLENTVLGEWIKTKKWWKDTHIKPTDTEWFQNTTKYCSDLLHHIAPDKMWKDAVSESAEVLDFSILTDLNTNPELSVIQAVNTPVILGSDDNVSLCICIL